MVTELLVDDNGRLTGVKYVDENDEVHIVTAKVVVLAAGSNEDARLMLISRSRLFKNGVGNNHDAVGRNITSHAYVDANGFLDYDLHTDAGPGRGAGRRDGGAVKETTKNSSEEPEMLNHCA